MELAVLHNNVEETRSSFIELKDNGVDPELVQAKLERTVRERAMTIASTSSDDTMEEVAKTYFLYVIELCKAEICGKSTATYVLQDMCEISCINRCERLFNIIEEIMPVFKPVSLELTLEGTGWRPMYAVKALPESNQAVLRMCNDILRRLSRCAQTSFSGRILSFLSRYLPLSEKSGLNLWGVFNTQNTTKYDMSAAIPTELLNTTADEDMETGEIRETKDSIPVNEHVYTTFWQLQEYFSNPIKCFDKTIWKLFSKQISEVLALFYNHRLDRVNDESSSRKRKRNTDTISKAELVNESETYFAKYLTSPKLLQLQLNDSQFRRCILVQALILFQYLLADVKFKHAASLNLSEDQQKFVRDSQDKCYRLLKETHPRGSDFAESVKNILNREEDWSTWKNQGCPDLTAKADPKPMLPFRKRPRPELDMNAVDLGSPELTRIWAGDHGDLLGACKHRSRKFLPTMADFLRDPLDEMDPEQQVEECYKSVNQPAWQWRASRYLMQRSAAFVTSPALASKSKSLTLNKFLEQVIYDTAKTMDEFRDELAERERSQQEKDEREARKLVENSLVKKFVEKEGSNSPGPDFEVTDESLTRLAKLMDADALASALEVNSEQLKKIQPAKESDASLSLKVLMEWAQRENRSHRKLRNALLIADLLNVDVVAALRVPDIAVNEESSE